MCSFEMLIDEVKGIGKCWRCGKDRKLRQPVKKENQPKNEEHLSGIKEAVKGEDSKASKTWRKNNPESPAVEAEQEPKEEIKEEIPEPEQPEEIHKARASRTGKKNDHQSVILLDSIFECCEDGYIYTVLLHKDKTRNIKKIKYFQIKNTHLIPNYIFFLIKNFDAYFSPSVCKQDLGYAGRSKEHISAWLVLWCDIDIYKFDEIKRAEVWRLVKECPLQPTFIVKSGRGIHVYWKLREPCTDMSLIENYLNRIAAYFSGDRTEAAHLLRIPQTKNHKYEGEDAEVKIIHSQPENQYNLSEFDFFPETESTYGRGSKEDPGNYKNEMNERLKKIMECDFLRHCDRGRATLSEREWHAMISILSRETGGPNLIHSLSRGYPGYSPQETDRKILHTLNDAGPATCERIKELWSCGKNCGVKSPISLAYQSSSNKNPDNGTITDSEEKGGHHFNLIRASDVVNTQEAEKEWIWEGILISGGSSLIVAKPKVGKTTLALQLAVAVSRGDSFLGRKTRQATVVYLALEEHRDEVQKNLSKLGVTNEPLLIHFGPAPAQAMQEVEPLIRETGAKLLVIDILQKFCRVKDLNDYSQVTRTLEPLMAAGRNLDCQISLTHHAGKADREDGDDILGSTGLLGGVDTSIHIKKRNPGSRVFSTIQRYGVDIPQTVISLKDGLLVVDGVREEVEIGETMPLILAALGEGPLAEKDIWAKVEKDHSRVSSALRKLVEQEAVIRTGTGKRGNPFIYEKGSD
jgi:hypothetical protein